VLEINWTISNWLDALPVTQATVKTLTELKEQSPLVQPSTSLILSWLTAGLFGKGVAASFIPILLTSVIKLTEILKMNCKTMTATNLTLTATHTNSLNYVFFKINNITHDTF